MDVIGGGNPVRILQIGKFYDPVKGGMETALRELSEGLAESGHEVTVAVSSQNWRFSEEKPLPGLRILRLPTFGAIRGIPLTDWRGIESQSKDGFDIVHAHLPNPFGLQALLKSKAHKYVTIHALTVNHPLLSRLYDPRLNLAMEKVDQVIFTSSDLRRQFVLAGTRLSRPGRVIPLGIKCDWWRALPRVSSDFGGDLLFVGRLVPYKGLGTVLRALPRVKSRPRLVVVGDGPERSRWANEARDLGLQDQVVFAGQLEDEELHRVYMNCRVVVLPSINEAEAFGLSMVEGLAAGRPLICSDLPTGVRQVNRQGETGLRVKPGDVEGWAHAIDLILGDPLLYGQM
ncbi:MAG: glycosyltransferase [Bdellovibrionales bacterium]|nr:glycosyltransferase [Bdellovibrionales bacterium]